MRYAKVENGQVTQIDLPSTGTLKDGRTVSGYNMLDEVILLAEGWLPILDNPPVHNADTEYLEHAGYTIEATDVVVNYNIKQKEPIANAPTTEERLTAIEEALLMII
jgi:hypothetical protein